MPPAALARVTRPSVSRRLPSRLSLPLEPPPDEPPPERLSQPPPPWPPLPLPYCPLCWFCQADHALHRFSRATSAWLWVVVVFWAGRSSVVALASTAALVVREVEMACARPLAAAPGAGTPA